MKAATRIKLLEDEVAYLRAALDTMAADKIRTETYVAEHMVWGGNVLAFFRDPASIPVECLLPDNVQLRLGGGATRHYVKGLDW